MGEFKLFDLLQGLDPALEPKRCKVHLAGVATDGSNPLDQFFSGEFDYWQSWQSRRNFERPMVIALLQMAAKDRWLLAGAYDRVGITDGHTPQPYRYDLRPRPGIGGVVGRLVVRHRRTGRSAYRLGETLADELVVSELRAVRLAMSEFPGFDQVRIRKRDLDVIVDQSIPSWRAALSHVAGVYLITDVKLGRQYVGSATGADGIWSRWSAYRKNGHGGNKLLRALLKEHGANHTRHFQYGLLEVGGSNTTAEELLARESHWKDLLGSRAFGLNAN